MSNSGIVILVIACMPYVVTVVADSVNISSNIVEGILVRSVMSMLLYAANTANDRVFTSAAVRKISPFAGCIRIDLVKYSGTFTACRPWISDFVVIFFRSADSRSGVRCRIGVAMSYIRAVRIRDLSSVELL